MIIYYFDDLIRQDLEQGLTIRDICKNKEKYIQVHGAFSEASVEESLLERCMEVLDEKRP